ncbi:hypothetical protein KGA66_29510, partial [Actinocrinis puniceicyclus]
LHRGHHPTAKILLRLRRNAPGVHVLKSHSSTNDQASEETRLNMPVAPKPSYEELAALVVAQQEQITLLTARIAELEAALKQNSKNSSKPVCHEREGGARM